MALQPGVNFGPYEIVALLGAGGMGEVYLAREVSLGRRVALKVLPPEFTQDAQRIARFEQEARSASALSHPNICTIFALGQATDGQRYIAMEYVEGQTLRERLSSRPLAVKEAVDVGIQIASALSDAHTAGVLHRDIKPDNVMVRSDGLVKVLDFGLAKLAASTTPDPDTTRTAFRTDPGSLVGTVVYMSPEQARGQQVDARSDIWSLGVLLYEAISGRNPFGGQSSSDVLAAILDRDPAPLARFEPEVPAELQRIVSRALRKGRDERYQSVKDLLLDLKGVATQSGTEQVVRTSPTRLRIPSVLAVVGLICAAAGLGWWYWGSSRRDAPQPLTERVLRRITFGEGLQTDPTFSPDGRFIAFASDRSGSFDVWVQAVAGGDAVRITKSDANDVEPDWSPDGTTIAFRSDRDGGGIFAVPALGGSERRLATFGVTPRWSPDGSAILFASALPELVGLGAPKLYLVEPTAGATVREFAPTFNSRIILSTGFDWFPDGSAVSVYAMLLDGTLGVFNVSSSGDVVSSFVDKTQIEIDTTSAIRWSKSADHLYIAGSKAGVRSLWRLRADRDAKTLVQDARLTTGAGPDGRPVISRDGTRIAFVSEKYGARLWAYPLDRAGRVADLKGGRALTDSDSYVESLDLDATGNQVVYTLINAGSETRELRLHNLNTGVTDTLTSDGQVRFLPQWSHSATAIAYVRSQPIEAKTLSDVAVWRLGGGEEAVGAMPSNKMGLLIFDWTPSDEALVASFQETESSPFYFVLVDPKQRTKSLTWTTLLRDDRYNLWQATYSPNGQWMALVAQARKDRPARAADPVSGELVVMRVGQTDWKLVLPGWNLDKPRWSVDGRLLYFIARSGQAPHNVWGVEFDDTTGLVRGAPFQVTRFDGVRKGFISDLVTAEIAVSARSLLIPVRERSGSIWMLEEAGPAKQSQ